MIYVVVITLAILSVICVGTMASILFVKTYADPTMLTAFTLLTGNVTGALMAILSNTRQNPKPDGNGNEPPPPPPPPAPVVVQQPPNQPVPVDPVK